MTTSGYTVQITNLSLNATDKDVCAFFALCGAIQQVELVRVGDACTAYVTFRNPHAVETALLLNGDTILDQTVCITQWGHYEDDYDSHEHSPLRIIDESDANHSASKAVSMAQEAVKNMAAKGYVLGKGAVEKAKAFGESHQVPAKFAELSEGIGLTNKINAGVVAARSVDQRYHISGTTKSAVRTTQMKAISVANAVVSSSYFSKGAIWLSGALSRASQVAGDLGGRDLSR